MCLTEVNKFKTILSHPYLQHKPHQADIWNYSPLYRDRWKLLKLHIRMTGPLNKGGGMDPLVPVYPGPWGQQLSGRCQYLWTRSYYRGRTGFCGCRPS